MLFSVLEIFPFTSILQNQRPGLNPGTPFTMSLDTSSNLRASVISTHKNQTNLNKHMLRGIRNKIQKARSTMLSAQWMPNNL